MPEDETLRPIPLLEDVIAKQVARVGVRENETAEEVAAGVLQRVRHELTGLGAMREAYEWKHRGTTMRENQVNDLRLVAKRLAKKAIGVTVAERVWLTELLADIGRQDDVAWDDIDEAERVIRQLADRLECVQRYKLDRKWRPYLYGALLPEIAQRTALIPPTVDNRTGEAKGPCIDFVRACLKEMGEEDAAPETVAEQLKRNKQDPDRDGDGVAPNGWDIKFLKARVEKKKNGHPVI